MDQRVRVLIVEDTADHADLIRMVVEEIPGFGTTTVGSMRAARAALEAGSFDVILSDLNLPDSGRDETVRNIREHAPRTAVVVLTCDAVDVIGKDTITAGAQGYIRKDELATSPIERVLGHAMERQRILNENIDLTGALQRQNKELEAARRQAEAAMRAKTAFLANVSHEIRTPMTAILGFIDIAMATPGVSEDKAALEALSVVQRNGEHLLLLINDILDVTKVEAGAIELELIPTAIGDVVGSAVECLSAQAVGKGISLGYTVSPSVPDLLMVDPTRLRQILVNLVGNAVKFTSVGGVDIRVSATPVGGDRHAVSISVRDSGIGMSVEEVDRIGEFGVFSQANTTTTRRFGGTGLGLRVCQGLATLMGGSIGIESEAGRGSEITLRVVLDRSPVVSGKPEQSGGEEGIDLSGMRVLIADDSTDNRRLLTHYLRAAGASTECVVDGLDAASRMADRGKPSFDLVLMDLQMPRLDGFGALRTIRESGCTVPIFASSASAAASDQQACLRAGFDGFVAKPVVRRALLTTVRASRSRDAGRAGPNRAA